MGLLELGRLRIAVYQRAFESQIVDRALQLLDREIGILHRERCNSHEAAGTPGHLGRQRVVCLPREIGRSLDLGNALDGRGVEGGDHDLDAACIHQPQPLIVKVQQPVAKLGPDMGAERL